MKRIEKNWEELKRCRTNANENREFPNQVFIQICSRVYLSYTETPWNTWKHMKHLETPWNTLKYLEIPWSTLKYLQIQGQNMTKSMKNILSTRLSITEQLGFVRLCENFVQRLNFIGARTLGREFETAHKEATTAQDSNQVETYKHVHHMF